MSVSYSQTEPLSFRAGITIVWQKGDFSNFNRAEGYTTAKYTINGNNGLKEIEGSWDSSTSLWTFTLTAALNTLAAGTYTLFGYVQHTDGSIQPVYEGTVLVKASLTTATQVDTRSHVKIVLDAIEATMEKRATKVQESQQLPNGTAISMLSPSELIKWYEHYKYLYTQELDKQRISNGGSRRKILPTFQTTS